MSSRPPYNLIPPRARLHVVHWRLMLAGGTAILVLLVLGVSTWVLQQRQALADAQIASLQGRLASLQRAVPVVGQQAALPTTQREALKQAISNLNLPWRDLFDVIETSTPAAVALLSLEPKAERSEMVLVAQTTQPEQLFEYLRRLKREPLVAGVSLTRHEWGSESDPGGGPGTSQATAPDWLRFTLVLRWDETRKEDPSMPASAPAASDAAQTAVPHTALVSGAGGAR
jgi:hypothetical protein